MNVKSLEMSEAECQHFLQRYAFGTLITTDLSLSHIPFVFNASSGKVSLHLAKINPQLAALDGGACKLSVLGPHAYISTENYVTKPAVPTWNYASVSVAGQARLMSKDELDASLVEMLKVFQPELVDDKQTLPDTFFESLSNAIVGVEISVDSIRGILKLNQGKKLADQQKTLEALMREGGESEVYASFTQTWLKKFRAIELQ